MAIPQHLRLATLGVLAAALVTIGVVANVGVHAASSGEGPSPGTCLDFDGLPTQFGQARHSGMVRVPAGSIQLGARGAYADEQPSGERVQLPAFWIDRTEVTNAQFAAFVRATGYVTDAEREGAAAVFRRPARGETASDGSWWVWQTGANWRQPEGPQRPTRARPNEPVVLVTYADALAYARWLGRELPTEAQWEYAARGGGEAEQVDREPRDPAGRPVANYWQGIFPDLNTGEDGYAALAPVGCFPRNGYGLADMIGNVWELTRDRYTGPHQPHGNGNPAEAVVVAHAAPRSGETLVIKGGSFLCAANYCVRYRVTARHPQEADMATSHVGFRTVLRDDGTS